MVGPLLGGWLIDVASWRAIFLINVPLAAAVVALTWAGVPRLSGSRAGGFDWPGAALLTAALGSLTYGLTEWAHQSLSEPAAVGALLVGSIALMAFSAWELQASAPMLPPRVWNGRAFVWINVITFFAYGALGGVFLWLVVTLQVVVGLGPLAAGLSLLPITLLMLGFSPAVGSIFERRGLRGALTSGHLIAAIGVALLTRLGPESSHLYGVLLPTTLLGIGLTVTVAPLTIEVLAALPAEMGGAASGFNNTVARTGSLVAIAALQLLAGLGSTGFTDPSTLQDAFAEAMWICAALLVLSAVLAMAFLPASSGVSREESLEPIRKVLR